MTTENQLNTLNLSDKQIKEATGWPDYMVNDYQTNFRNSVVLALSNDGILNLINKNTQDLLDHENSTSEHGVNGDNIGSEDFAKDITGGVVLLMSLVNNAVDSNQTITIPDIADSPVSYSQAYMQTIVDMTNDIKAKHNQLVIDMNAVVTQLNDLIAKSKTAKQMSA